MASLSLKHTSDAVNNMSNFPVLREGKSCSTTSSYRGTRSELFCKEKTAMVALWHDRSGFTPVKLWFPGEAREIVADRPDVFHCRAPCFAVSSHHATPSRYSRTTISEQCRAAWGVTGLPNILPIMLSLSCFWDSRSFKHSHTSFCEIREALFEKPLFLHSHSPHSLCS